MLHDSATCGVRDCEAIACLSHTFVKRVTTALRIY